MELGFTDHVDEGHETAREEEKGAPPLKSRNLAPLQTQQVKKRSYMEMPMLQSAAA